MVGDCMECRKREEEMYWSHFQTVQFCQFLSGRFDQQLAIPKKFADSLREKMAGTVDLRGPSGHVWSVGLVTNGDTLLLKNGWKSFVEDHSLVENDILIFRYNGNSRFDVLTFDQESLCEQASSYFVKKCEHGESGHAGDGRKGRFDDGSEFLDDDVSDDCRVKRRRVSEAAVKTPSRIQLARSTSKGRTRTKKGRRGSSGGYPLQLKSRRREVTEDEKSRAQQTAVAAASSDSSFVVVMRASHVYKGFFMSIPADWAKAHLPKRSQDVALRVNDKTWVSKFLYKGYGGGLCNGWKKFVVDNYLEESDVCVFDLASGTHETCTLDVRIFRVVEEVIPPCPVTRPNRKRSGGFLLSEPLSEDNE